MWRVKKMPTKYELRIAKSRRHMEAQEKRWDTKYPRRPRIKRGR